MADPPVRILVFDLPPLLNDLVLRAIDDDASATNVEAAPSLEQAVSAGRPDAVIVPLGDDALHGAARRLLEERARLRILGIGLRNGRAVLHELRPARQELGEAAPAEMVALIRRAVRHPAAL